MYVQAEASLCMNTCLTCSRAFQWYFCTKQLLIVDSESLEMDAHRRGAYTISILQFLTGKSCTPCNAFRVQYSSHTTCISENSESWFVISNKELHYDKFALTSCSHHRFL